MKAGAYRGHGQRPFSAGDGPRWGLLSAEHSLPLHRQGSSLERGIVGAPPPLVRDSDHRFTAAEVERLLVVRETELLSVRRRLHRTSKKNEALESTVSILKEEGVGLRKEIAEGVRKRDAIQLRVAELEDAVKRKGNALKTAIRRRERTEETATAERAQAWGAAKLARVAQEEERRRGASLEERARDAETQVKSLELRLETSKAQASEAKHVAAEELATRLSAHKRERTALETAALSAEEENRSLKEKLTKALEAVRQKQETEQQTDKVVRELQAWRERVARGEVVEMSSSEAKRLRWSEEQTEVMKEANATLRSELLESGRLLAEAQQSFETVAAGFGDAGGTIGGLSARLDQKTKDLEVAERGLRASRAEVSRLKKLGLSKEQRRVRGRERALDSTQKGMEALVRGRQEEIEARAREAEKRRGAERASARASEEKESLRRRAENAEECSREMDAERRVLLQHLAAAREEVAFLRSKQPTKAHRFAGPVPTEANRNATTCSGNSTHSNTVGLREATRCLLERAVTDWSVKSLFSRVSGPVVDRRKESPGKSSADDSSSEEACLGGAGCEKRAIAVRPRPTKELDGGAKVGAGVMVGLNSDGEVERRRQERLRRLDCSDGTAHPLEVVRVYGAPEAEGSTRTAGWRWDLTLPDCAGDDDSIGARESMRLLGLGTLGRALRERGVRGEGARTALSAVARVFDALLLTRSLAAQQCAQARTELALALGRLSTRSALVSDTRTAARRASAHHRTLLLRLVGLELRHWRGLAAAAVTPENVQNDHGVEAAPAAEHSTDGESVLPSTDDGDDIEPVSDGGIQTRFEAWPRNDKGPGGRWTSKKRASPKEGLTLDLSNLGVDDETLCRVVRKIMRTCIRQPQMKPVGQPGVMRRGDMDQERRYGANLSKPFSSVPLARLLLRGNDVSDSGALALAPLVRESPQLTTIDLRDNAIGSNGKLALKKALTCNPWVHRVISEDVCTAGKKGKPGGLVLFAKRRSRSTASDRARAYAFEVFPPSSHTIPGRATAENRCPSTASECDSFSNDAGEKQEVHPARNKVGFDPAPAFEGPGGCLGAAKDEMHKDGGRKKRLHLMPPSALETSAACCETVVAASFKIDLRGCSRRPTPLPLVETCDSGAEDLSPNSRQRVGRGPEAKGDRRRVGRRQRRSARVSAGSLKHPKRPGWLDSAGNGSRSLHARQGTADAASGTVAAPMRSLPSARYLTVVARDGGDLCPLSSESQDTDELNSLLSVSRRIFSKAEAFEDMKNRHRQQLCWKKLGPKGRIPDVVVSGRPGELDPPTNPNSPDELGKTRRRGAARESTSPPPVVGSSQPKRINTANTAPDVAGERSGPGIAQATEAIKEESEYQAHLDHTLGEGEEHPSLEAVPPIASTPTPSSGDEALDAPDGVGKASLTRGHAPFPSSNEGIDATQQVAKELPVVDSEDTAVVGNAANWDGPRQASDAAEWVYDEATASWYPALAVDDGQGHNDGAWRYDKPSATWYQEEAVPGESGPQEPSRNGAPHSAEGTAEVAVEAGDLLAYGQEQEHASLSNIGHKDTNRSRTRCGLQLNEGSQENKKDHDASHAAGELLAKRIKALELALGDS